MTVVVVVFCHVQLQFQEDLQITHMYSSEGEEVQLLHPVRPTGNVENWLGGVEKSMKLSLRDNIERSVKAYPEVSLSVTGRSSRYFSIFGQPVLQGSHKLVLSVISHTWRLQIDMLSCKVHNEFTILLQILVQ